MPQRTALRFLALFVLIRTLPASALIDEGEKLILDNKLREAAVILEQALEEDPDEEKVYLYLGVIYEQLGDTARAVSVMSQGLSLARRTKPLLCFNIGNSLFKQGQYPQAELMYSQALGLDAAMSDAYLNRANTRLRTAQYPEAVADYVLYLHLAPGSPQKAEVQQMIDALNGMLAQQEQNRQDAAARQKALMDDVLASLKNASSDAKNVAAGSEKVQVEFQTSDIED